MRAPANDNPPIHAADFSTLAERRAWVQSLPAWDGRPVTAWPTATRLLRAGRYVDLSRLVSWRDLTAPILVAANDNTPDLDKEGEPIPASVDSLMEIRPTVGEIKWGRAHYSVDTNGTAEASGAFVPAPRRWPGGDVTFRVGNLRFKENGALWKWKSPRGWETPRESHAHRRHTRNGEMTIEAEHVSAEDELVRYCDSKRLRVKLGALTADVLDLACSPATAEAIALEVQGGKVGKSAQRRGVALVDCAIAELAVAAA